MICRTEALCSHTPRKKSFAAFRRSFLQKRPSRNLAPAGARRLSFWSFFSYASISKRKRTLGLKLTFYKSTPLSLLLGVCRFFFVKRGAKKNLSKRNAEPAGKEVAFEKAPQNFYYGVSANTVPLTAKHQFIAFQIWICRGLYGDAQNHRGDRTRWSYGKSLKKATRSNSVDGIKYHQK